MLNLLIFLVVMVLMGFGVMYNGRILAILTSSRPVSESLFYRLLGRRVKRWNLQVERRSSLKKDSYTYKINAYFKDIIVNLGMTKDNVTPIGLITFITSIALAAALLFIFWSGEIGLFIPTFAVIFYFLVVLFRFFSLLMFERKESEIMDTEDLVAMDVAGGVYNAILRYRHSFHQNIRPYFEEFIDNIQNKGFGFQQAMLILNDKLGPTFTDFAQKAILYEEKADANLVDIFSSIVELNRHKRILRYENDKKFSSLRWEFLLSVAIILGYGLFSITSDSFMAYVFEDTIWGKILILFDILLITGVLSYLASIKAKFL